MKPAAFRHQSKPHLSGISTVEREGVTRGVSPRNDSSPTDLFTIMEPQNPPINDSSIDGFLGLKLWKGRSGNGKDGERNHELSRPTI